MNDENKSLTAGVEETVAQLLMRALYDEVTNIRVPWTVMPQQQQQELLDRLQKHVDTAVTHAVNRIARMGFKHIAAVIDSLTIKDDAKCVLMLARGTEELHTLADHVGGKAIVVFADPAVYTAGMDIIKSDADQRELPLDDNDQSVHDSHHGKGQRNPVCQPT